MFFDALYLFCMVRECWLRHGAASVYVYAQHAQVSVSRPPVVCLVCLESAYDVSRVCLILRFGDSYINERPLHTRKFAFLSDSVSGELQLGGYDRESTAADMVYVKATSTTEYSVNVQSLTFGGIELLDWVDKTVPNAIPAIMDTGTTCLVIPDTVLDGRVSDRPFSKFKSIMTKGMSFYITIDGHLFEIPYEFWWQRIKNAPCVQATPPSYAGILLGDVVFQSLVVEFDLSKPKVISLSNSFTRPPVHPLARIYTRPFARTHTQPHARAHAFSCACCAGAVDWHCAAQSSLPCGRSREC